MEKIREYQESDKTEIPCLKKGKVPSFRRFRDYYFSESVNPKKKKRNTNEKEGKNDDVEEAEETKEVEETQENQE